MSDKANEREIVETVKLRKSLDDNGTTINELNFTEMTVEDMYLYEQTDFIKVKVIIEIAARLTGNRESVLKKMHPADFFKCSKVVQDFFGLSQEIQPNL